MSDKELLELAAKAAGIEIIEWRDTQANVRFPGEKEVFGWNPLASWGSSDSMHLAVTLGMHVMQNRNTRSVLAMVDDGRCDVQPYGDDAIAATRRAIVCVAAEIGKATGAHP